MLRLLLLIFFAFNIIDGKYVLVETEDSSEAGKVVEPVHVVGQVPQAYEVNFKYIRKYIEQLLLKRNLRENEEGLFPRKDGCGKKSQESSRASNNVVNYNNYCPPKASLGQGLSVHVMGPFQPWDGLILMSVPKFKSMKKTFVCRCI